MNDPDPLFDEHGRRRPRLDRPKVGAIYECADFGVTRAEFEATVAPNAMRNAEKFDRIRLGPLTVDDHDFGDNGPGFASGPGFRAWAKVIEVL